MPFQRTSRKYGSGRTGYKRTRNAPPPRTSFKRRRITPGTTLAKRANAGVQRLTRMIETKEATWGATKNQGVAHNDIYLFQRAGAVVLNPFQSDNGTGDPMVTNAGDRLGDNISVKGLQVKVFFENALGRGKVFYRLMLLKCAKGDTPTRANMFKGASDNKMMDQLNTERFTVVKQQIFTISASNAAASSVQLVTGAAVETLPGGTTFGGIGSKIINWWVPGKAFGRDGIVQYENRSTTQVKFYDYRLVVLCYDWYGTPQDINDVGRVNECYTKLYFKDA